MRDMDPTRFDELTRALVTGTTRRRVLGGMLGALGGALGFGDAIAARCGNPGSTCTSVAGCCGALTCVAGRCQTPSAKHDPSARGCPIGQTRCGGACFDVNTDDNNCGACGAVCSGVTPLCSQGSCICTDISCPPGFICCNGSCVAGACCADSDCGACETCSGTHQCLRDTTRNGEHCSGGICVDGGCCASACGAGDSLTCCAAGATCTSDGICCASGVSCNDVCCDAGYGCCNGTCIDLTNDLNNCGACGNACSFPHATSVCSNGTFVLTGCAAGFADCDGNPANGCEVEIADDQDNCGACGNVCPPGAPICLNSLCTDYAGHGEV